jgi:hypothetical protein
VAVAACRAFHAIRRLSWHLWNLVQGRDSTQGVLGSMAAMVDAKLPPGLPMPPPPEPPTDVNGEGRAPVSASQWLGSTGVDGIGVVVWAG